MDDVTEADVPTFGVMVTTTGYQSGARNVADTYGIVILELRQPTDVDLADRVLEVNIMVEFRIPRVVDLEVEVVSALSEIIRSALSHPKYSSRTIPVSSAGR